MNRVAAPAGRRAPFLKEWFPSPQGRCKGVRCGWGVAAAALIVFGCQGHEPNRWQPVFGAPKSGVFVDPVAVVESPHDDLWASVSTHAQALVYASAAGGNLDIFVRPLAGGASVRLTTHSTDDSEPAFSPDGRYVTWVAQAEDVRGDIWVMRADGSHKRRLTGVDTADRGPVWSGDGRTIYFSSQPRGALHERIDAVEVASGRVRHVVAKGWDAAITPDERVIFYVALDSTTLRPRLWAQRLSDGRTVAVTDGAYVEGFPRVAVGRSGIEVVFARFVDDNNNDGTADGADPPSLWRVAFDAGLFTRAPPPTAQPLTAGEGGELFAALGQEWLLYSTASGGDLGVYALPTHGVIAATAAASAILEAARTVENPALRRLALRYLVATSPEMAAPARYELARRLAEGDRFAEALEELGRVIAAAPAGALAGVARVEQERLRLLQQWRGVWLARDQAARVFAQERLAAAAAYAQAAEPGSPVDVRYRSLAAEVDYALGARGHAVRQLQEIAVRRDAPLEDVARALNRLGMIYAECGDVEAVGRVTQALLQRAAGERYYVRQSAERWVNSVMTAPHVEPMAALASMMQRSAGLPAVAARAAVALARLQEQRGAAAVALNSWRRIAEEHVQERDVLSLALFTVAQMAARQADSETALAAYARIMAAFPEEPALRWRAKHGITALALAKAQAEEEAQLYGQARQSYARLIDNDPEWVVAHRRYVSLSHRLGLLPQTVAVYRERAAATPRDKVVRYAYGYALTFQGRGQLKAARRELEAALVLDARFAAAHLTLGWVRLQLEDEEPNHGWLERAENSLDTALGLLDPQIDAELWAAAQLNRGNVLLKLAKFDDAFAAYLAREQAGVPFEDPLNELLFRESFARAALAQEVFDVALDMATLAARQASRLEHKPRLGATTALLAAINLMSGRYDEAALWFGRAADIYRDRRDAARLVPLWRGQALALEALGRDEEALQLWTQLVQMLARGEGPKEPARPWFASEIAADPTNMTRGINGFAAPQEEEIALAQAARRYRERAEPGAALRCALQRLTLLREAARDAAMALRLRPEMLRGLYDAAQLLMTSGRAEEASPLLREAIALAESSAAWPEVATLLETMAVLWSKAPRLRTSALLEQCQKAAMQALAARPALPAPASSDDPLPARLWRWLALEQLRDFWAASRPSSLQGPQASLTAHLDFLDQRRRAADAAFVLAQRAGDAAVQAHAQQCGGQAPTAGAATAAPPALSGGANAPAQALVISPPAPTEAHAWRWWFDQAWRVSGAPGAPAGAGAVSGFAPEALLAAITAFETAPVVAQAPERALFLSAAVALLLSRHEEQRAWRLLERDRLFALAPPAHWLESGPMAVAWRALRQARSDAASYQRVLAAASPLLRAVAGQPTDEAAVTRALGSEAILVQLFALEQTRWFWCVMGAVPGAVQVLATPPIGATGELPAPVAALLAANMTKTLYLDAGELSDAVIGGWRLAGTPLAQSFTVVDPLSATYLVAAHSGRNFAGLVALPPPLDKSGAGLNLAHLVQRPQAAGVWLIADWPGVGLLRRRVAQAALLAGTPTVAILGHEDGGLSRAVKGDMQALKRDLVVAMERLSPVGAARQACAPAAAAGAAPGKQGHAAGCWDRGLRLLGYGGLDFSARVALAGAEVLRLAREAAAQWKLAEQKQQEAMWRGAQASFAALLDAVAFLQQPAAGEVLQNLADAKMQRVAALLPVLQVTNQGNLAQTHVALEEFDAALGLQEQVISAHRHSGKKKELAQAVLEYGRTLVRANRHEAAARQFAHCSQLAVDLADTALQADCLLRLGSERRTVYDYPGAEAAYEQAAAMLAVLQSPQEAEARRYLGFLYENAFSDYPQALTHFQQAKALAQQHGLVALQRRLLVDEARVQRQRGDYELALQVLREAQALTASGSLAERAGVALEMARIHWYRGNYAFALKSQQEALDLAGQAADSFVEIQARSLDGLIALNQGELERAQQAIRYALELSRLTRRKTEEAAQLNNLGFVLRETGAVAAAIELFRQALAIDGQLGSKEGRAYDLRNLAVALTRQGNHTEALASLDEALKISRDIGNRYNELQCQLARAETLEALADAGAAATFGAAVTLARQIVVPEVEWRALYGLARAAETRGQLDEAADLLERALVVAERLGRGRSELGTARNRDDLYEDAIRLAVARADAAAVYNYTERAKSRALADVLASRLLDGGAAKGRDGLAGVAAASAAGPVSLAALQQELPREAALVSYFVGAVRTTFMVITRRHSELFTVPIKRTTLVEAVRELHDKMRVFAPVQAELLHLSELLIQPSAAALKSAKHLVISPHGVLHHVPFAALILGSTASTTLEESVSIPTTNAAINARESEALVQRFSLSSTASCGALYAQLVRPAAPRPRRFAAWAPSPELPFAELEALAIAPAAYVAQAATETSLRAARVDAVDIAAHAALQAGDPLGSALQLRADATHDGRVEVREVFGFEHVAPLVTLSACDSANYDKRGDEWLSLAQAFISAGARSVVASHNRVADLSAAVLMKRFYRQLGGQSSPAEALQGATLWVRQRYSHPAHWANFVLYGDFR